MSENLSVDEIKLIWRLCIDYFRTGRTFKPRITQELLEVRPYRVKVSEELRDVWKQPVLGPQERHIQK